MPNSVGRECRGTGTRYTLRCGLNLCLVLFWFTLTRVRSSSSSGFLHFPFSCAACCQAALPAETATGGVIDAEAQVESDDEEEGGDQRLRQALQALASESPGAKVGQGGGRETPVSLHVLPFHCLAMLFLWSCACHIGCVIHLAVRYVKCVS